MSSSSSSSSARDTFPDAARRKRRLRELVDERNRALLRSLDRVAGAERMTVAAIWDAAVALPAPRLYISEENAARIIRRIRRGAGPGATGSSLRVGRYLWSRYCAALSLDPALTPAQFAATEVYRPAPEFFISGESARKSVGHTRRKTHLRQSSQYSTNHPNTKFTRIRNEKNGKENGKAR